MTTNLARIILTQLDNLIRIENDKKYIDKNNIARIVLLP